MSKESRPLSNYRDRITGDALTPIDLFVYAGDCINLPLNEVVERTMIIHEPSFL